MNPTELLTVLASAYDREALGHAILFVTADPHAELQTEFRAFRALLMCGERKRGAAPPALACGQCASCLLALSEQADVQHPDLVLLHPGEKANYVVEDVRALLEKFALTRSLGLNRVAWIDEADLLSSGAAPGAANALLKLLEEPRPQSYLILVTARPEALLPTIRSRCQVYRLPRVGPSRATEENQRILQDWLELETWLRAGAAPGRGPTALPADDDAYWKDREAALNEADQVFGALWDKLKDAWSAYDREAALRVMGFFTGFEACLAAIRGYGNAPLQWLAFRSDARLDP